MTWRWLGHFSVRIEADAGPLYVDPYLLKPKKSPTAAVVLVTNSRVGHCSEEDVEIVRGDETAVLGPADAVARLGFGRALAAGETAEVAGFRIRAVPAYTVRTEFFPREKGGLGYVIEAAGRTYYHAGATDRIPEMAEVAADVAFLPVSGRYVMDAADAARAAEDVGAATRVPLLVAGDRYRPVEGFVVGPE